MNNPYYRFYGGRWWSTQDRHAVKRYNALETVLESLLYPELHKKKMKAAKFLAENAHVMLPDDLKKTTQKIRC